MREALFWTIVAVVAGGQLLLMRSAWRLHRNPVAPPAGVPRSDPRADLLWTLGAAALTAVVLGFAFLALP